MTTTTAPTVLRAKEVARRWGCQRRRFGTKPIRKAAITALIFPSRLRFPPTLRDGWKEK